MDILREPQTESASRRVAGTGRYCWVPRPPGRTGRDRRPPNTPCANCSSPISI